MTLTVEGLTIPLAILRGKEMRAILPASLLRGRHTHLNDLLDDSLARVVPRMPLPP
jgi:hypothetical protein